MARGFTALGFFGRLDAAEFPRFWPTKQKAHCTDAGSGHAKLSQLCAVVQSFNHESTRLSLSRASI